MNTSADIGSRAEILDRIMQTGAVAVIRMTDSGKLLRVARALREGGLTAIEITMTVPNALRMIEEVSRAMGNDIILGVGSVLNGETAQNAIDAGARYVVSPIFKPEIIDVAHSWGLPAMPGCFTPTEIFMAQEYGADIVKVFPADVVGMEFFRAIKAPMPHLKMMPTGGVSLTNAGDWIRAGACAVGVGGALLDKQAIEEGRYEILTEHARALCQNIASAR